MDHDLLSFDSESRLVSTLPKVTEQQMMMVSDLENESTLKLHLELMMDKDLSAWVSQESVRASTSALSCSQASLLAGPSRPETQTNAQTQTSFT